VTQTDFLPTQVAKNAINRNFTNWSFS